MKKGIDADWRPAYDLGVLAEGLDGSGEGPLNKRAKTTGSIPIAVDARYCRILV